MTTRRWPAILGLILAALSAFIPVVIWLVDFDTRGVEVSVISKANLDPSLPDAMGGQMEVVLDGKRIFKPYFVVIEIRNSGNQPIMARDVETPITLSAGPARISRTQVMKTTPASLSPRFLGDQNQLSVSPLLLNPGDSFQVGLLTSGEEPRISATARIAGIRDVKVVDSTDGKALRKRSLSLLLAFALCVMYSGFMTIGAGRWLGPFNGSRLRDMAPIPLGLISMMAAAALAADEFRPYRGEWTGIAGLVVVVVLGIVCQRLIITKDGPFQKYRTRGLGLGGDG